MVKLEKHKWGTSDFAAASCLLGFSLTGVSTTHTKTTVIMGVEASKRLSSINWNFVGDIVLGWILTFLEFGLIGFLIAKLFFIYLTEVTIE